MVRLTAAVRFPIVPTKTVTTREDSNMMNLQGIVGIIFLTGLA